MICNTWMIEFSQLLILNDYLCIVWLKLMKINSIQLRKFLFKTTQSGYGNPDTQVKRALDGANVIDFQEGDWRMLDTCYGGQPYAGAKSITF